jgi:hypothetical protein
VFAAWVETYRKKLLLHFDDRLSANHLLEWELNLSSSVRRRDPVT